jgi:peptidoglycan/LPS O-acetylase OafA/YrhL
MEMFSNQTLEDRLVATGSRCSGFDYLRIVLAILLLLVNTAKIVYGEAVATAIWNGPLHPLIAMIWPMFFALSGFLVASSLERCRSVVSFIGLRILRVLPALVVAVLFSAVLVGPMFTSLRMDQYFTDPRFYTYLLNMFGQLHWELPGVFTNNQLPNAVNLPLWVVPREAKCYLLLVLMSILGLSKPTRQLLLFLAAMHIGAAAYFLLSNTRIHDAPNTFSGFLLLSCFVVGASLFVFRRLIAYSFPLFAIFALLSLALLIAPGGAYFASIPLTYATIYVGLWNPARSRIVLSGDYAYGMYLYAFPVQQAVASLVPAPSHWYVNAALALPSTVLLAVASWWMVQRPIEQRLRPAIFRIGDRALVVQERFRLRWVDWLRRALSNE